MIWEQSNLGRQQKLLLLRITLRLGTIYRKMGRRQSIILYRLTGKALSHNLYYGPHPQGMQSIPTIGTSSTVIYQSRVYFYSRIRQKNLCYMDSLDTCPTTFFFNFLNFFTNLAYRTPTTMSMSYPLDKGTSWKIKSPCNIEKN